MALRRARPRALPRAVAAVGSSLLRVQCNDEGQQIERKDKEKKHKGKKVMLPRRRFSKAVSESCAFLICHI